MEEKQCFEFAGATPSIFDPSTKLPYKEDSLIRPSSPYGAAKAAGEAYCVAYHRSYGLDTRIARIYNVYGEGVDRFIVFDFIQKLLNKPSQLEILGTGHQIRDFLHIDDLVDGLMLIASKGSPGEDYNLASGQEVKIIELAKKIAVLTGQADISILPTGQSWPGDILAWYADISKIERLGFKVKTDLESGLRKTIAWILSKKAETVLR